MNIIDQALKLAIEIHNGQKDRYGKPYVLHPLRVMMRVEGADEKTAAILHDVVEDSELTVKDLERMGFPEPITKAVDCLSRREREDYFDYIERVKESPLAITIKLADLEDNMDIRRAEKIDNQLLQRLSRYREAWGILKSGLDK